MDEVTIDGKKYKCISIDDFAKIPKSKEPVAFPPTRCMPTAEPAVFEGEYMEDFEQGDFWVHVKVRKKWWQFWLPKTIPYCQATYTRIGKWVTIYFDGWSLTTTKDQITGFPSTPVAFPPTRCMPTAEPAVFEGEYMEPEPPA